MPEAVRLVIWDLDDTFWRGTLTEGGITEYVREHHDIVIELARRGIMSSICSKNDPAVVMEILKEEGIAEYFIFPSISWAPKAARLASIIEAVQFRAPTVMFVDDNHLNRAEAADLIPDMQIEDETFVPRMLNDPRFKGKDDSKLTRLAQYKLLETRHHDAASAGDNTDFLRSCNIRVTIEHDVLGNIDRAVELVNRTNQLNFTKRRLPEDLEAARRELSEYVRQFNVLAGLIRVKDKYGDYGFIGFYAIETGTINRMTHFCFSCRILDMSVEHWLFAKLGRPYLAIVGEVLSDPTTDRKAVDWITVDNGDARHDAGSDLGFDMEVVARGGCDLQAISHYFRLGATSPRVEANTIRSGIPIRLDHSSLFRLAADGVTEDVLRVVAPLGYVEEDFSTHLFDPPSIARVVLLSNWADASIPVFKHRDTGLEIPWHLPGREEIDLNSYALADLEPHIPTPEVRAGLHYLRAGFDYLGLLSPDQISDNLRLAFDVLERSLTTRVYVLLINEWRLNQEGKPFYFEQSVRLNQAIRQAAAPYANITLLDVRGFINSEAEMQAHRNHFDRLVYFRIYSWIMDDLKAAKLPRAA